jgi:hypothetical protein
VLDNIVHVWLTKTAVSAARLYWENAVDGGSCFALNGVKVPVAVSVFPDKFYQAGTGRRRPTATAVGREQGRVRGQASMTTGMTTGRRCQVR